MKKWLAAVLLLMICAGVCAQGTRVEFAGTFSILKPDELEVIELGEDEFSEGMVYAAISDEMEMYAWSYDMDGLTQEDLYQMWLEDDFLDEVSLLPLGEGSYITYVMEDEGMGAVISCKDGTYYDLVFYCQDESSMSQARQILESIEAL